MRLMVKSPHLSSLGKMVDKTQFFIGYETVVCGVGGEKG